MAVQTLGHYRVKEKLGAGGMGEVYRAHDESLDRDVALKVLPAESFADPAARARLLREARTASQLNHPNICTIHEVGEAEGQAYIAMELVDGQPLSARLESGALPADAVLRYGLQLTEALEHAHERNIVHRDFKSANVIITREGRAKVLDFGLAKRFSENEMDDVTRSQASLTTPGTLVGTLAYMAPEQFRGEPADTRSDIWALGIVLYEMSGGARPFAGKTGFELTSAIMNQPAAPLPAKIPVELKAVIERCLEKEPARRYQRAGEVRAALEAVQSGTTAPWTALRYTLARRRWLAVGSAAAALLAVAAVLFMLDAGGLRTRLTGGAPRIESLAVLPLENLSGDASQDYFADGMTEALITDLARIGNLKVIARSSVMRYKGTKKSLAEIARELKVQALITGAVLRSGNGVRITAQLIDPATEQQLWADRFERELRDVLALQNEVTRAIATEIKVKLSPVERARLATARPVNPDAYEAFLKGMQQWYKLTPADLDTAERYFAWSLQKDPNYAPSQAGMALVWGGRSQMGITQPAEAVPKMKEAALRALALDDGLAESHYVLAIVKTWHEWDWAGAEQEFRRAIDINPNYPDARAFYSHYLNIMNRPKEAMAESQRALELDPFNALFQSVHAMDLVYARRYDDAIVQSQSALRAVPGSPVALSALEMALFLKGRYPEHLETMKSYFGADPELAQALDRGYAEGGYHTAMRRGAEVLAARSRRKYWSPVDVAAFYVRAGDKSKALDWLEKGFDERNPNMPYLVWPDYETLWDESRFQDIVRRMNLPMPQARR